MEWYTVMHSVQCCNFTPQRLHDKRSHGVSHTPAPSSEGFAGACPVSSKHWRDLPVDDLDMTCQPCRPQVRHNSCAPTWLAMARTFVSSTTDSTDMVYRKSALYLTDSHWCHYEERKAERNDSVCYSRNIQSLSNRPYDVIDGFSSGINRFPLGRNMR